MRYILIIINPPKIFESIVSNLKTKSQKKRFVETAQILAEAFIFTQSILI